MAEVLPDGYYLDNFRSLLEFTREQYSDLLTAEEIGYAENFGALSADGQRLYVRLISRRGPLFRDDKLRYPEIGSIRAATTELCAAGYLDRGEDEPLETLLALLTKPDLAELIDEAMKSWPRAALVELAREKFDAGTLRARVPFQVLRPLRAELLELYRLLFFGNLSQDLTEFVLTDLGLLRYESYPISRAARAFESRTPIDRIIQLRRLAEEATELMEGAGQGASEEHDQREVGCGLVELLARIPAPGEDEMVRRRTDRLLNRIGRQLEREGMAQAALSAYVRARAAPSRERRCRILERAGDLEEALALAREMLAGPLDEGEHELACRFIPRLERKLGLPDSGARMRRLVESEFSDSLALPFDEDLRVEEAVRMHLEGEGHRAFYVENHLFLALFGLAFWETLFQPVRGAFFNRYQSGPADLYTPEFAQSRSESIARTMSSLEEDPWWHESVLATYRDKAGIANPFVHWQRVSGELISLALTHIPRAHLQQVFRRLLWDLRNHRSGFPDLVAFERDEGYRLIEVKGPGDRLQENQKRWMRAFLAAEMPVRVVNVTWC